MVDPAGAWVLGIPPLTRRARGRMVHGTFADVTPGYCAAGGLYVDSSRLLSRIRA